MFASAQCPNLAAGDDRQFDEGRPRRVVEYRVVCNHQLAIFPERLTIVRVTVEMREVAARDFNANAVSRFKLVASNPGSDRKGINLARRS